MRELENEEINRLVNGVNVNNTRNVNNTYRQSTLPKFEMKK